MKKDDGRKRGRKLTDDRTKRFCQAIEIGATYVDACKYAGFSFESYATWMNRAADIISRLSEHDEEEWDLEDVVTNEAEVSDYDFKCLQLLERVKSAEGNAVVGWLAKIEAAANAGTWTAAAWKLERRSRGYERDQRLDVSVSAGGRLGNRNEDEENEIPTALEEMDQTLEVLADIGIIPGATPDDQDEVEPKVD